MTKGEQISMLEEKVKCMEGGGEIDPWNFPRQPQYRLLSAV